MAVLVLLILAPLFSVRAHAVDLSNRQIQMTSSAASASNVTYGVSFDTVSVSTIGSIAIEFCDNNPFPEVACTPPAGFDASTTSIINQNGIVDFSISPASTAHKIILSRPAGVAFGVGNIHFELDKIHNPNTAYTFYARVLTYPTTDASGLWTDVARMALMTSSDFGVSAEVPPFLYFCTAIAFTAYDCNSATSYFADFGELSATATKTATSQMILGTNADFGVTVSVTGATLTSGNNIIPALPAQTAPSVGVSQFGINLRANSNPAVGDDPVGPGGAVVAAGYNVANQFKFVSGDAVVTASDVVDYRKFTTSYITNINTNQAPGVYNTTLTYIALANF